MGIISACTASVRSYDGLVSGAGFSEQSKRYSFPVSSVSCPLVTPKRSSVAIGGELGGLIAAEVLKLNDVHGNAGWRWLPLCNIEVTWCAVFIAI